MPSSRIWPAKWICKKRRQSVYYLHTGPPCGPLWFLGCFKNVQFPPSFILCFYIFIDFLRQSKFILPFFRNCAPRSGRKHNSRDGHTPTCTLKIAISHPSHAFWTASWLPFFGLLPSIAVKLNCKKNWKTVYLFYKSLLWGLPWEP